MFLQIGNFATTYRRKNTRYFIWSNALNWWLSMALGAWYLYPKSKSKTIVRALSSLRYYNDFIMQRKNHRLKHFVAIGTSFCLEFICWSPSAWESRFVCSFIQLNQTIVERLNFSLKFFLELHLCCSFHSYFPSFFLSMFGLITSWIW